MDHGGVAGEDHDRAFGRLDAGCFRDTIKQILKGSNRCLMQIIFMRRIFHGIGNASQNIRTILRQSVLSNKPTFRSKSQRLTANMMLGYKVDPAMLQVRDIQRLTFDNVLSFYEQRVKGKPITILIMGDPKLINQKQIQAKHGKITKLNKSRLFSY